MPLRPSDDSTLDDLRLRIPGDERIIADHEVSAWTVLRRLPQLLCRSLALAWKADRFTLLALLGCQVLSAVAGAVALLAISRTAKCLASAQGQMEELLSRATPWLISLALAAAVGSVLRTAIAAGSGRLGPRVCREAEFMLLDAAIDTELSAYDRPGYNDRWDAADRGIEVTGELVPQTQHVFSALASALVAFSALSLMHPLLLVLLLLSTIPRVVTCVHAARVGYRTALSTHEDRRMLAMLRWHLVDRQVAEQVRTDTMAPYMLSRYREAGGRVDRATDRSVWTIARASLWGAGSTGLALCLLWSALVWLLSRGHLPLTSGITAAFALTTAGQALHALATSSAGLYRIGLYVDDWGNFIDEARASVTRRGTRQALPPHTIDAEDVCFTYPNTSAPALSHVSLQLRRGEVVALVGENGSGKSTLTKLLCGLYLPDSGTVRWDGTDIADLDPRTVWRHTSAVPQTFAQWPDTCRQNITLGQRKSHQTDHDVSLAAAAAGADEVIDRLPRGLDTLLTQQWWGGVALSRGQWQRLAIARAFHRNGSLLILDEPTSDLDPRAEHRIFTGLRRVAADRAVILVTHHIANTTIADRIIVLERGRIVQQGTFNELAAQAGRFRELWELSTVRRDTPEARINATVPPESYSGRGLPAIPEARLQNERPLPSSAD
jgi:ATP-binding cassette subfamily B protein